MNVYNFVENATVFSFLLSVDCETTQYNHRI